MPMAPEAMSRLSHVNGGGCHATSNFKDGKGGREINNVTGRVTSGEGVTVRGEGHGVLK